MVYEIRSELSQSEQRRERERAAVWHCGQTATAGGAEPAAVCAGEEEMSMLWVFHLSYM